MLARLRFLRHVESSETTAASVSPPAMSPAAHEQATNMGRVCNFRTVSRAAIAEMDKIRAEESDTVEQVETLRMLVGVMSEKFL